MLKGAHSKSTIHRVQHPPFLTHLALLSVTGPSDVERPDSPELLECQQQTHKVD